MPSGVENNKLNIWVAILAFAFHTFTLDVKNLDGKERKNYIEIGTSL